MLYQTSQNDDGKPFSFPALRPAADARITKLGGLPCPVIKNSRIAAIITERMTASLPHAPPILYGHHHLNVTSVDSHKKFWVDALGGISTRLGSSPDEVVSFPQVLIFLRPQAPTGGTKGTTVNHIAFQVSSARAIVDQLRAAGYPIVTASEVSKANSGNVKNDLAWVADQNTYVAYTMAPDDLKIELVENKNLTVPVALHHLHFFTPQLDEMKAWYVKVLGATPGKRGSFEAADLPGVNLTFSPSAELQAGTKGRVLDHIGFEVQRLENFCKTLEAMGIELVSSCTRGCPN